MAPPSSAAPLRLELVDAYGRRTVLPEAPCVVVIGRFHLTRYCTFVSRKQCALHIASGNCVYLDSVGVNSTGYLPPGASLCVLRNRGEGLIAIDVGVQIVLTVSEKANVNREDVTLLLQWQQDQQQVASPATMSAATRMPRAQPTLLPAGLHTGTPTPELVPAEISTAAVSVATAVPESAPAHLPLGTDLAGPASLSESDMPIWPTAESHTSSDYEAEGERQAKEERHFIDGMPAKLFGDRVVELARAWQRIGKSGGGYLVEAMQAVVKAAGVDLVSADLVEKCARAKTRGLPPHGSNVKVFSRIAHGEPHQPIPQTHKKASKGTVDASAIAVDNCSLPCLGDSTKPCSCGICGMEQMHSSVEMPLPAYKSY
eukprot:5807178-Pleurochrysis_carterae.AAC.1